MTSFQLAYILGEAGVEPRKVIKKPKGVHKVSRGCYLSVPAHMVKQLGFVEGDSVKFEITNIENKELKLEKVQQ